MSDEQAIVEQHEQWIDEPSAYDELGDPETLNLPSRPRRRLLTPVPAALLAVLLTACGFIAGVLVEKGQASPSATGGPSGLAARLGSLRSGSGGGRGGASFFGGGTAGGVGPTMGQVAYIAGHTLYVTTPEGATVKVTTSALSTVSKTVKASVKGIHPGETVVVTGSSGANGSVNAEEIRVSEAGASSATGGIGALFRGGGGEGSVGRGSGGGGKREAGSGGPVLFGP